MPENEIVQNILSQSTPEASFYRFLNNRNWKNSNLFNYKTGVTDMLNEHSQMQQDTNNYFSSLTGNKISFPTYTFQDSLEKANRTWKQNEAVKRAEARLAKEKEAASYPTFSTSYDITRGWRDATEDAARLDKYVAEELGASPELAQSVYNDTWNNANKTLGIATAGTLGLIGTMGAAGGAFGPIVADIANAGFAADGIKNLVSGHGVQKTYRLAKQGDWKGALKSGAMDALDLSMLGHTVGLGARLGKSVLSGRNIANAYRSDIAGRVLAENIRSKPVASLSRAIEQVKPTNTAQSNPLYEAIDLARKGDPAAIEKLQKYGIPVGNEGVYRFAAKGEIDDILRGSRYNGRFGQGLVDVTSNKGGSTAASSDYRVTFGKQFDLYKGDGRTRLKNEKLGDGYISEGYGLDDVDLIEKLGTDGKYYPIYTVPVKPVLSYYHENGGILKAQKGKIIQGLTKATETIKNTGSIPEKVKSIVPTYQISDLGGGYMLKSLMRGNPLEKQLSKTGTIATSSIQSLIGKSSKVDQAVVNEVLSRQFPGQKVIDYNQFRKAVQDELIKFDRVVPEHKYDAYGMERLGFSVKTVPDGIGGIVEYVPGVKTRTFSFESPRIPIGNPKHYDPSTLGHTRTYTTPEEPDILHIMESQSDWAQGYKKQLSKDDSPFILALESELGMKLPHDSTIAQSDYLAENYLPHQLQENIRFAAEHGQTKLRYPTRETVAKIENYPKASAEISYPVAKELPEFRMPATLTPLSAEEKTTYSSLRKSAYDAFENDKPIPQEYYDFMNQMQEKYKGFVGYKSGHESILRKYDLFPKQFGKLFPKQEVRLITDPKFNTWYEVDVPKGYLGMEWAFKDGGILSVQKGRVIKALGKAVSKSKKVELTGDLFAEIEAPKSVLKPRNFRGYGINPDAFSGVENLTPYHWGYNRQMPMLKAKEIKLPEIPVKTTSNWDKFLQKSLDKQDRIVKFWNGENYSSFNQLKGSKDYNKFVNWINKQ